MLFFKKKESDFIKEKENQLKSLQEDSFNCLNSINNMIYSLSATNENIDRTIIEIEEGINKLTTTSKNLAETKIHNEKIINKFKTLIEE